VTVRTAKNAPKLQSHLIVHVTNGFDSGKQGCSGVGTAFRHLLAPDYIKTRMRSHRCASDT